MGKEIMMTIGKVTEQEALMEMLDRDDEMVENVVDFLTNYWKQVNEH